MEPQVDLHESGSGCRAKQKIQEGEHGFWRRLKPGKMNFCWELLVYREKWQYAARALIHRKNLESPKALLVGESISKGQRKQ
jgi:hypothetical protein